MIKSVGIKNEGMRLVSIAVRKLGAAEFGRRVCVSEGMVRHLLKGRKTPGPDLKARIEAELAVTSSVWNEPPLKVEAEVPREPAPITALQERKRISGIDNLRSTIERYDMLIERADVDPDISETAWVALLRGKTDASDKLAKLQGEGELTIAMVVRSRAWGDLMAAIEPVLADHPDVAAKIAGALERLESA